MSVVGLIVTNSLWPVVTAHRRGCAVEVCGVVCVERKVVVKQWKVYYLVVPSSSSLSSSNLVSFCFHQRTVAIMFSRLFSVCSSVLLLFCLLSHH